MCINWICLAFDLDGVTDHIIWEPAPKKPQMRVVCHAAYRTQKSNSVGLNSDRNQRADVGWLRSRSKLVTGYKSTTE